MENIKEQLKTRGKKLIEEEDIERSVRVRLRDLLTHLFQEDFLTLFIEEIHIKNNSIIIQTKNKTAAYELYLHKEHLEKQLGKTVVVR